MMDSPADADGAGAATEWHESDTATRPRPGGMPNILALDGYGTSRPPEVPLRYRLSSNENSYPPLRPVVEAISAAAASPNLYPPLVPLALAGRLGAVSGVDPQNVWIGAGSVAVLEQLIRGFAGPGDEVIFGWRSYEAYPIIIGAAGAVPVPVPLIGYDQDLAAMARRVGSRTRIVILCNPNNPTGTALSPGMLRTFAASLPADCLLILDEAYREFVPAQSAFDGTKLIRSHANVAVLRTFSKAHGLAGMRVGFAVAAPAIIEVLARVALPFTVGRMAVAAASASLDQHAKIQAQVRETVRERDVLIQLARRLGLPVSASAANFLWLSFGSDSGAFTDRCAAASIGVRCFPLEGVRITVGSAQANAAVAGVLKEYAGVVDR